MKRLIQFSIAAFVLVCVLIFAVALGGGLMDSTAFTEGTSQPARPAEPSGG